MREKESNSGFGIIFMFIGGLLTIIAGVLLFSESVNEKKEDNTSDN